MGLYASSQKVLAGSNHRHHVITWHTDCAFPGICSCTVYLYAFLILVGVYVWGGVDRPNFSNGDYPNIGDSVNRQ